MKRCALLLTLLVFIFAGCGTSKDIVPFIDFVRIEDNGKTILVQVGGGIEIDLPADSEKGYAWKVKSYSQDLLKLTRQPRHKQYTDSLGSGGFTTFNFQGIQVGKGQIVLELYNTSSEVEETFTLIVDIRKTTE